MKYKIHVPHCQYGFIEAESEDINELIQLNNKYNENGTVLKAEEAETKVKSFNEEIEIDKIGFSYFYAGDKLLSPSSWIKKYYKPFDQEFMAGRVAKAYGVEIKDVLNLWLEKGKLSADFGTVIHNALEINEKYRNLASNIIEAKQKKSKKEDEEFEDQSIAKHPILKKAVEGFNKINNVKGKAYPEILVTDVKNGRCGIIDRFVVTGDKRCVIQDFKVQVDVEEKSSKDKPLTPYDNLDSNKLSKFQLQLSYYAEILEQTGWKVDKLQAFVYDGKWKKYEFKKLEIK